MSIALAKSLVRGTCVATNGSYDITGDETNFLADVEPGFLMYVAGVFYQVDKVISANQLTLTQVFLDTSIDGVASEDPDGTLHYWFQIIPTHAYTLAINKNFEETSRKLDELTVSLPAPADNSITNAQLANMPPSTIKARFAGSTGDPQDITVDQLAQMLINAGYPFATGNGDSGGGVANGGQTGQVLVKNSNLSGDAVWKPLADLIGATGAEAYRGPWGLYLENVVLEFDQNFIPPYFETNAQATPMQIIFDPDAVNGTSKALTFPQIGNNAFCEVQWAVYADENLDRLRIRYKANGEPGYDPFIVYVDGVEVFRKWGDEQLWQDWSYVLPHGPHLVKFHFSSDGSSTRGIQNVRWSRIEFPRQQQGLGYNYGDTVNFNGSIWYCLKAGTTAEPGSNNDWKAFGGAGAGGTGGSGSLVFSSDATGADTFTMNELHTGAGIDSTYANGKVSITAIPPKVGKRGANGTDTIAGDAKTLIFQGDIVTVGTDGDKSIVMLTTPHDLPVGGAVNQILIKTGAADRQVSWGNLPVNPIMTGGATRQVLAKNSSTAGDVSWITLREPPQSGLTGQRLAKSSNADGAFTWVDQEVPAGGAQGKLLGKLSATDRHVGWIDPPSSIPNGGVTRDALVKKSNANGDVVFVALRELPVGGTQGQRLVKENSFDGRAVWADPEIPAGGTMGQALRKLTNGDREIAWQDVHEVPAGGETQYALRKSTTTDYDATWYPVHEVPAGGNTGDVLTKLSATDYDANWRPNPKVRRYLDVFTSSGTWTKRAGAFRIRVVGFGAGGGGGGGSVRDVPPGSSTVTIAGGSGGMGGAFIDMQFRAEDLGATEAVTIGSAGVGGAGGTATDKVGKAGTLATASSFGSKVPFTTTFTSRIASSAALPGREIVAVDGVRAGNGGGLQYAQTYQNVAPNGQTATYEWRITNTTLIVAGNGSLGNRLDSLYNFAAPTAGSSSLSAAATDGQAGTNIATRPLLPGASGAGGGATNMIDGNGGRGGNGSWGAGGGGGGAAGSAGQTTGYNSPSLSTGAAQGGRGGDGGPSIIWVETWTEE